MRGGVGGVKHVPLSRIAGNTDQMVDRMFGNVAQCRRTRHSSSNSRTMPPRTSARHWCSSTITACTAAWPGSGTRSATAITVSASSCACVTTVWIACLITSQRRQMRRMFEVKSASGAIKISARSYQRRSKIGLRIRIRAALQRYSPHIKR